MRYIGGDPSKHLWNGIRQEIFWNSILARKKSKNRYIQNNSAKTAKKAPNGHFIFKKLVKHAFHMFITLFKVSVSSARYLVSKVDKEAFEKYIFWRFVRLLDRFQFTDQYKICPFWKIKWIFYKTLRNRLANHKC